MRALVRRLNRAVIHLLEQIAEFRLVRLRPARQHEPGLADPLRILRDQSDPDGEEAGADRDRGAGEATIRVRVDLAGQGIEPAFRASRLHRGLDPGPVRSDFGIPVSVQPGKPPIFAEANPVDEAEDRAGAEADQKHVDDKDDRTACAPDLRRLTEQSRGCEPADHAQQDGDPQGDRDRPA